MIAAYRTWLETFRARGAARSGTLARVIENALWLLGGKAVGAVLSLAYIGLATRALGPENFGRFVLILGTGQAINAIVTFSTWQIVVRYGVAHLQTDNRQALGRLLGFCFALDTAAAISGCVIAAIGVALLGPRLGWEGALSRDALLFCCVLLLSTRSTAVGILRLHDRFGIAAAADSVTPVIRMVGALVALDLRPDIAGFLIAWAAAEVLTAVVHWLFALREARGTLHPRHWRGVATAHRDNPGLWRFAIVTNMGQTLKAFGGQISLLLVGLYVGPAAAGGYRLAFQLGRALARLSDMLSRSMFAELARVHIVRTAPELRQLFRKSTRFAIIGGVIIVLLLVLIGKPALGIVAGSYYRAAFPLLLMLGIAAALDLGGSSFEPALMATDRASLAFRLRFAAVAMQIILLMLFLPTYGAVGAAGATLAASILGLALFGVVAWQAIHRRTELSTPVPSA